MGFDIYKFEQSKREIAFTSMKGIDIAQSFKMNVEYF